MNKPIYPTPLIPQRADPLIYRHTDGKYYFTASVPAFDLIELRIADTITGLAAAKPITVWKKHDSGAASELIWAPEIHYVRGKWYIYFAAAHTTEIHPQHNTFQHRMYVLEAEDPTGEWVEKGEIKTGMESFCLDATVFEHGAKLYYCWAQKDPEIRGNSNIYIAEMENPWTLKTKPVLLAKPEYEWECSVIPVCEGPAVLKYKDKIFIAYSANATGIEYCVGLLTANADSDLLNPKSWTKSETPVFGSCVENGKYGPGHNSFTVAEDGVTPLIVFHSRDYTEIVGSPLDNPDRHTCVQAFAFDDSGYPVFGVPKKND